MNAGVGVRDQKRAVGGTVVAFAIGMGGVGGEIGVSQDFSLELRATYLSLSLS
jgi:hypothetical protein